MFLPQTYIQSFPITLGLPSAQIHDIYLQPSHLTQVGMSLIVQADQNEQSFSFQDCDHVLSSFDHYVPSEYCSTFQLSGLPNIHNTILTTDSLGLTKVTSISLDISLQIEMLNLQRDIACKFERLLEEQMRQRIASQRGGRRRRNAANGRMRSRMLIEQRNFNSALECFNKQRRNLKYITDEDVCDAFEVIFKCSSPAAIIRALEEQTLELAKLSYVRYPEGYWRALRQQKEDALLEHICRLPDIGNGVRREFHRPANKELGLHRLTLEEIVDYFWRPNLREMYFLFPGGDAEAVEYLETLLVYSTYKDLFRYWKKTDAVLEKTRRQWANTDFSGYSKHLQEIKYLYQRILERAVKRYESQKIQAGVIFSDASPGMARRTQSIATQQSERTRRDPECQRIINEEIQALYSTLITEDDDELDEGLLYVVKEILSPADRRKLMSVLAADVISISEKNFILGLFDYFPTADYSYVVQFSRRFLREKNDLFLQTQATMGSECVDADSELSTDEIKPVEENPILTRLGFDQDQYEASVMRFHTLLEVICQAYQDKLTVPELKVLKYLINCLPGLGRRNIAALDYLYRTYGEKTLIAFFINPSLLMIGYKEIDRENNGETTVTYTYELKRLERLFKAVLTSIPAFVSRAGKRSLDEIFSLKQVSPYRVSFVAQNRCPHRGHQRPLHGWIKEMQMVAKLREKYGERIVWEPDLDEVLSMIYHFNGVAPDALDVETGTIIEIVSLSKRRKLLLHDDNFMRKKKQLLRYRELYETTEPVKAVKLIVVGKIHSAAKAAFEDLMKGIPFSIECYDYRTLKRLI
jgi:hypothetical protein